MVSKISEKNTIYSYRYVCFCSFRICAAEIKATGVNVIGKQGCNCSLLSYSYWWIENPLEYRQIDCRMMTLRPNAVATNRLPIKRGELLTPSLGYQNATTIGRGWSLNAHRNVSASDPAKPVARTAVVMGKQVIFCYDISEKIIFKTSSSAVAERPRDASYHCIFCKVTQGHSKWNCWVGRV